MDENNVIHSLIDRSKIILRKLVIKKSLHRNDALGAIHRAWGYIHANQIIGDYYEFGVYNGTTLFNSWLSYQHFHDQFSSEKNLPFSYTDDIRRFAHDQAFFYGFDTFEGMPDNAEGEDSLKAKTFCGSYDLVAKRCQIAGLSSPQLILAKGLFSENSHYAGHRPAAIVHIDCDLYASTVDALQIIEPHLIQGSIVLCDDYNLFRARNDKGERLAIKEFQERSPLILEPWFAYGVASQAFLCHRTD